MSGYSSTYETPIGSGGGFIKLVILFVFLGMIIGGVIVMNINYGNSHAIERHGSVAVAGHLLCDPGKFTPDMSFFNEETGRCVYATEEDSGRVFIQIVEGDDEITLFISKHWDAAMRTIERYGYILVE